MSKKLGTMLLFVGFVGAFVGLVLKTPWEKEAIKRAEEKFINESLRHPATEPIDTASIKTLDSLAKALQRDTLPN